MIDLGGTYRAVSPSVTLEKVTPLLWEKFGITRVANITGLDDIGIPTYIAIRPRSCLLSTAQGKGITEALAKVSAIMECIEGWHAENMPPPDLYGSYDTLKETYPLLPPTDVLNIGPIRHHNVHTVQLPWAKGTELNTGKPIYFPYTLVNVRMDKQSPGTYYFPPSTNGLASGNTLAEATCHALFEVIEREIEAAHANTPGMQVDLNSITSPHLRYLIEKIESKGLTLTAHTLSHALDIPTYQATIHDANHLRSVGTQCGSGTHFSSVVALSRAITEAVQSRLTVISGSRDDIYPSYYHAINRKYADEPIEKKSPETMAFTEKTIPTDNFDENIALLCQRLAAQGFKQVIRYNHTRSDVNIPVVHIVVPGTRLDTSQHSNGTLYHVDE